MKRLIAVLSMLAGLLVPLTASTIPTAHAHCAPPANEVIYKIASPNYRYFPTNIKSDWVVFPRGGSISYSRSKTMTVSAAVTATVSGEVGAIFAKASTSLSVQVGGSYAQSQTWTYSANIPADRDHKYRLHAYHYTVDFSVMKRRWVGGTTCTYKNAWSSWQRLKHVPLKADRNVWRVDRAGA